MKQKKKIYLDYAATTPVDPKVLKVMEPYFVEKYGNPSSVHSFGQEAREAVEKARNQVAEFLNCKASEIVFTGSATESNNLAIRGLLKDLEKDSVKITYLPVGRDGIINLDDLRAEITPETDLVSIMYVNNETGAIQPIKKIGSLIKEINKTKEHPIFFHTDAVQAVNWLNCKVDDLGVDLLTFSGHKIYGPKGIGVLYIRTGIPVSSIVTGGEQEWGLRAGTENVANIVGLGAAVEEIKKHKEKMFRKVRLLQEKLEKRVLFIVPKSRVNGPQNFKERAPHICF